MEKKHYSIDNVFLMADAHNIMDRIQLRNLKEIRSTKKTYVYNQKNNEERSPRELNTNRTLY